jgi:hypothetical protein
MKTASKDAVQALLEQYDTIIGNYMMNFSSPSTENEKALTYEKAHVAAARRMISTKLKKFFDAEYESSKLDLAISVHQLNPTVTPQIGAKMVLMHEDKVFQVYYTVRNGPSKLDDKKLRMLLVQAGVEPDVVNDAFEKAVVKGAAQTLIDIIPVGEPHEDR